MSASELQQYLDFAYIAAAVLFILSLKFLSSPKSAHWGVLAGEIGAALAVVVTLFNPEVVQYKWVLIPLIIGAGVGVPLGLVHMTAVPQRTALSHAFGALSAAMIGIAEYYVGTAPVTRFQMGEIALEVIIGSLTFTGSVIAAGKLQEILPQRPIVYRGQNIVSLSVGGSPRAGGCVGGESCARGAVSSHGGRGADFRRAAGHADWRRGHADGDLAIEFLRRFFGSAAGICSEQ